MNFTDAKEKIKQYGLLATPLINELEITDEWDVEGQRKLGYAFAEMRRAMSILEKRCNILGSAYHTCWVNPNKNKEMLTRQIPFEIGWRNDWQIGYLSRAMLKTIRIIAPIVDTLQIKKCYIPREDLNEKYSIRDKELKSREEVLRITVGTDPQCRLASTLKKEIIPLLPEEILVTYDMINLTIVVPFQKKIKFKDAD